MMSLSPSMLLVHHYCCNLLNRYCSCQHFRIPYLCTWLIPLLHAPTLKMTIDAIKKERENQRLPVGQGLFAVDAACQSQLKSLYPSQCPSHLLGLYPCPAFPHFPHHSLRHLFITYKPYRNPIHLRSSHSSKCSIGPSPSAL
ncbi:hypothetical protein AX14_009176 [Amanita brunnescens Koide BX004]|nr:hypothetical protein AX14_009176 [Amanita brunnescens Koide BX004]